MLTFLCRLVARLAVHVVREYRRLEVIETVSIGIAGDDDIGDYEPEEDVYASTVGFSPERGKLRRRD